MEVRLSATVHKEGTLLVARGVEIELASQGKTVEDALWNLKEAFQLLAKHAEQDELDAFKTPSQPILSQVAATA